MAITFAQLTNLSDLFERAAVMPRPVRKLPVTGQPNLTLTQHESVVRVHPELPPTPVWTYSGYTPGPVVVVPAGRRFEVRHQHQIVGGLPFPHVVVRSTSTDPNLPVGTMNEPGMTGKMPDGPDADVSKAVAALAAHTVVHLHGGPNPADADGWAENLIDYGGFDEDDVAFPREEWPADNGVTYHSGAAPMYWYHDHAMGVTRFNVYAGLAGAWLVRDRLETRLGLPTSQQREIPLVLADRNLETDDGTATGKLTGRFLHKVETNVRECFAPINVVNGLAWPKCEVTPKVHRLRLVNGSNARTYRLHFMAMTSAADPAPIAVPAAFIQQIGTDGGLLGAAVDLPSDGLVMAPGERADVLVDFGALALAGFTHVAVYNNAPAPFQGKPPLPTRDDVMGSDLETFRPIPHVMRFDIQTGTPEPGLSKTSIQGMPLDPQFQRVDHAQLPAGHQHTVVVLREEKEVTYDQKGRPDGERTMLFLHEMMDEAQANALGLNLHQVSVPTWDPATGNPGAPQPSGVRITLNSQPMVSIGKRMHDASMVTIAQGSWHLWKVINLSPDTHPFHIHLTQLQAMSRQSLAVVSETDADFVFDPPQDLVLDANEQGWKDTVRVNPGEMVTLAGCFASHSGKYMYHCHILEHEDLEMMRSFTVLPADVMSVMGGHQGH